MKAKAHRIPATEARYHLSNDVDEPPKHIKKPKKRFHLYQVQNQAKLTDGDNQDTIFCWGKGDNG